MTFTYKMTDHDKYDIKSCSATSNINSEPMFQRPALFQSTENVSLRHGSLWNVGFVFQIDMACIPRGTISFSPCKNYESYKTQVTIYAYNATVTKQLQAECFHMNICTNVQYDLFCNK